MDPEERDTVVTGATTSSQPAFSDEVNPNRSGSGGSGGSATPDAAPDEEGGTPRSMEDVLSGEPQAANERVADERAAESRERETA